MGGCKCPNTRRNIHRKQRLHSTDEEETGENGRTGRSDQGTWCSVHDKQTTRQLLLEKDAAEGEDQVDYHRKFGPESEPLQKHGNAFGTDERFVPDGSGVDSPDIFPCSRDFRKETCTCNTNGKDQHLPDDSRLPLKGNDYFQVKSSQVNQYFDETDKLPEPSFSALDIIFCVVSIVTYLADVGSDIWVAYLYFTYQKWWYFGLTLAFVIVPGLTVNIFSLSWYLEDHSHSKYMQTKCQASRQPEDTPNPQRVHPVHWLSRGMLLALQLGPVMRYIEALIYGLWSKKYESRNNPKLRKLWYDLMLYEDTDSSLLRLIECFMESAPQLVMQLYILLTYGKQFGTDGSTIIIIGQSASCVTALASLSWAMAAYHRALRCSLDDKANMTYGGMTMQFFWRFFTVGSRVLALSLFASQFRYYVFVFVGGHWMIMLFWILVLNTSFCKSRAKELFFNIIMAVVYIFCYLNLVEGHTRLRYLFYYILVYFENMAMVLVWYFFNSTSDKWYVELALVAVLAGFFVGIMFQVLYYLLCHPNNFPPYDQTLKIRPCIPFSELSPTLCNTRDSENRRNLSKRGLSTNSDNSQRVIYDSSTNKVRTVSNKDRQVKEYTDV